MNLGEIESGLYDRLGHRQNPDSAVTRKVRRFINEAHREILGMAGFSRLRRATIPAVCTASDPLMVLPQAATGIVTIMDRTNQRGLAPISLQELRYRDPGLTFTSTIPDSYAILNFAAGVAKDPSAADAVFVKSDSVVDGTGLAAFVEGIITGGYPTRQTVAMNGTTAVQIGPGTWIHLSKFYLTAPAVGNVTLTQTSGLGTELARIPIGETRARYTQIHLSGTPASALTYYCDIEARVWPMVNPTDEPLVPEDYDHLLGVGALKRWYINRENLVQWKVEQANWLDGLGNLTAWLNRQRGLNHNPRLQRRFSQLGPWFPAGS